MSAAALASHPLGLAMRCVRLWYLGKWRSALAKLSVLYTWASRQIGAFEPSKPWQMPACFAQIRHHRDQVPALCELVAVAAVGAGDRIGVAKLRAHAGRDRLLADVEVCGTWAGYRPCAHPAAALP